jgi:hypothetical protein
MKTRALAAWALAVGACTTHGPASPAGPATPAAAVTASTSAAVKPAAVAEQAGLPPSDRVFFAGGLLLGADGAALWARTPGPSGQTRWRIEGEGVVHSVLYGDRGDGPRFFVARGVGRGALQAPLVLESIDPATGARVELWRTSGERNEPVTLALADVDGDGKTELAFSYYASKYMVRTRHLRPDGEPLADGPEIRMATLRLWADVDADGRVDEVLGRVYGDAKDVPGDLRVDRGRGLEPIAVENGIKSAVFTALGQATPALYFCDGWVANYGQAARARLKRLRFAGGKPVVEQLGTSPDEFTFFALTPADLDGDGRLELVAQGDKRFTLFAEGPDGVVSARPGPALEPVLNTAVGSDGAGRVVAYVPARPHTRLVPLSVP